jgi:fumarate reductase flavoprotein subunit
MTRGELADPLGRDFTGRLPLAAPYHAVKVTGALFHTQGGLVVDEDARVLRSDGTPFPNLFAGGGAARGISGPSADGYIAGNGLLTALGLGKLAGRAAAKLL